jgi:tetratricopeptide (TPR) repeat protein/phage FluMu protein Com
MLEIQCHGCGKRLRLADDRAGTKGKCARCGTLLEVPGAEDTGPWSQTAAAPLPVATPLPAPLPAPPVPPPVAAAEGLPLTLSTRGVSRRGRRMAKHVQWACAAGMAAVALVVGLALALGTRKTDEQPAAHAAPAKDAKSPRDAPTGAGPGTSADRHARARSRGTASAEAPSSDGPPDPDEASASARSEAGRDELADARTPLQDPRSGGLTGVSRRYDDFECQQIQVRHGVRVPAAAAILEVDGLRLPIVQPGRLAAWRAPILFLPRGSHVVRFRATESPVPVTIQSDLAAEYQAMRKYFDIGGTVREQELLGRGARAMDVHAAPFLLNFQGAWHAKRDQWEVAEREFRRALCVNPMFVPAHLNLAECLLHRGARDLAAREVELAEAFNVEDAFGLAGAVSELRRKLKLSGEASGPIDAAGLSYVGTASLSEEDQRLTALMEGISKYAVRDGERVKVLNNLAVHFADSGRPELALHYFRNALAALKGAGPERFTLARQIFGHMTKVCRKANFAEAETYQLMQNMVFP